MTPSGEGESLNGKDDGGLIMAVASTLPITNEQGFYEVRIESVGGLGANVAGKIFAQAGVLGLGLNGANFSSYGAEKKGTPVKAFVRFCDAAQRVRTASPVEFPHLLAILHESLIGTGRVSEGMTHETVVVVNSKHPAALVRDEVGQCGGVVGVVDAIGIAVEEKSRPNMVMLGAMARASGFMDPEAVKQVITDTLGAKYPKLLEGNLRAFDRGYDELALEEFTCGLEHPPEPPARFVSPWGYANAPMGGTIANPGNTMLKDLTPSRMGYIPHFHPEKCTNTGRCEYTCPDYCFVFEYGTDRKGKDGMVLKGIDYQYCKGCLRCVTACPTGALTTEIEDEDYIKEHTVSQLAR